MAKAKVQIELNAETKQAEAGFKGFVSKVDESVKSLTGLSLSSVSVMGALAAVGSYVKQSVAQYNEYAMSVSKAAKTLNMTTEEYSRLVQVADDALISQEQFTTAMAMMAQKGLDPSLDSLANIADELKNYGSAADKAAYLQEIFGRQWKDIIPMLSEGGDALREAYGEVADGLVVTDEAARAQEDLYAAWDDLNDSTTALSNVLAASLAPAITDVVVGLTSMIKAYGELVAAQGKALDSLQKENTTIAMASQTYAEYRQAYIDAARAKGLLVIENGNEVQVMERINSNVVRATNSTRLLTEEEFRRAAQMEANRAGYQQMARDIELYNARANETVSALEAQAAAMSELEQVQNEIVNSQDEYSKKMQDVTDRAMSLQETMGQSLATAMEQAGIKGQQFEEGLKAIDSVMGTQLVTQQTLKIRQQELIDQYKKTGDLKAFKAGMDELKNAYLDADQKLQALRNTASDALTKLEALTKKEWAIKVRIETSGKVPDIPTSGGSGSTTTPKTPTGRGGGKVDSEFATGGSFIVPAGYPNDSYTIGVTSGERVDVTPVRGAAPATIGTLIVQLPGVTNAQQMLIELGRITANRIRGGG